MLLKALQSRTIWMHIFSIALILIQAFEGYFSPQLFASVLLALQGLAGYFKLNPSQEY